MDYKILWKTKQVDVRGTKKELTKLRRALEGACSYSHIVRDLLYQNNIFAEMKIFCSTEYALHALPALLARCKAK